MRGAVQFVTAVYTGIGQLAEFNRPGANAMYSDFGHDQATGAITEDRDTTVVGASRTIIADRTYTRNEAGNITSIGTAAASVSTDTQCFGYDYLQNLTSGWTPTDSNCANAPSSTNIGGPAPYWTSYTIDPATGNRTKAVKNPTTTGGTTTTDTYSYPAAASGRPHAVQTVTHTGGATGTDSYTYDAAGNTKTRPGQTLTYDSTGKLSTVVAGSTSQNSVYDASGQLLLQSDGTSGSTLFLGDTELHIAAGSSTASGVRTYTAAGIPIAERTSTAGVSGTVLLWLGTDPQNTATDEVVVASGTVTRRYSDPYGNTRGAGATWSSAHGFLNAPVSTVSGLVQLGARAYDSAIGKFLSADGILAPLNPAQNNGYDYAGNSPVTNSDPSGYCIARDDGGGCLLRPNGSGNTTAGKSGASAPGKKQSKSTGSGGCAPNFQDYAFPTACQMAVRDAASAAFDKLAAANAAREAALEAEVEANAYARMEPWQKWIWDHGWSQYAAGYNAIAPNVDMLGSMVVGSVAVDSVASRAVTEEAGGAAGAEGVANPERSAQDVAVNPVAPRALSLNRPVGGSASQNAFVQNRISGLQEQGASDFRVNQQQVDISGDRVGVNRPDLQYTLNGVRHYEEFDVPSSTRGPAHEARVLSNDPNGLVSLFTVP